MNVSMLYVLSVEVPDELLIEAYNAAAAFKYTRKWAVFIPCQREYVND